MGQENEIRGMADTIRCAADVAARINDQEWCELVFAALSDELGNAGGKPYSRKAH
jgi:hypothetical protein